MLMYWWCLTKNKKHKLCLKNTVCWLIEKWRWVRLREFCLIQNRHPNLKHKKAKLMNMAFTKIIDFKNIKSRNIGSNLSNYIIDLVLLWRRVCLIVMTKCNTHLSIFNAAVPCWCMETLGRHKYLYHFVEKYSRVPHELDPCFIRLRASM